MAQRRAALAEADLIVAAGDRDDRRRGRPGCGVGAPRRLEHAARMLDRRRRPGALILRLGAREAMVAVGDRVERGLLAARKQARVELDCVPDIDVVVPGAMD